MAASWQTDPDAAKDQAYSWLSDVATAKSWDSSSVDDGYAAIDAAYNYAMDGSWWETDETTTLQFWERLYSTWGDDWPKGGDKLKGVWASAAQAAGSADISVDVEAAVVDTASDLGGFLEDVIPGEQDPDDKKKGLDLGNVVLLFAVGIVAYQLTKRA